MNAAIICLQLTLLKQALSDGRFLHKFLFLATHYPLLDDAGQDYSTKHPMHGVSNGYELSAALVGSAKVPQALLHGHVHRGYATALSMAGDKPSAASPTLQIFNPGAAGYRRGAAFNVFDVYGATDARLTRFVHNGEDFVAEPNGPYKS